MKTDTFEEFTKKVDKEKMQLVEHFIMFLESQIKDHDKLLQKIEEEGGKWGHEYKVTEYQKRGIQNTLDVFVEKYYKQMANKMAEKHEDDEFLSLLNDLIMR